MAMNGEDFLVRPTPEQVARIKRNNWPVELPPMGDAHPEHGEAVLTPGEFTGEDAARSYSSGSDGAAPRENSPIDLLPAPGAPGSTVRARYEAAMAQVRAGDKYRQHNEELKAKAGPAPSGGPPTIAEGPHPDAVAQGGRVADQRPESMGIMPRAGGGIDPRRRLLLGMLNGSDLRRQDAIGARNESYDAAGEALDSYDKEAVGLKGQLNAIEDMDRQRPAIVDMIVQNHQDMADEVRADIARMKDIDPQRWWNNQTTGEKVLRGIGMMTGAFAAHMPGSNGKNFAMDYINNAIENDIRAQSKNLDSAWAAVSKKLELGDRELARGQWMLNQRDRAKLNAIEKVKTLMSIEEGRVKNAFARTNLAAAKQQLVEQQEQIGQGYMMREFQWLTPQGGHDYMADVEKLLMIQAQADAERRGKDGEPLLNATQALNSRMGRGAAAPLSGEGGIDPLTGMPKKYVPEGKKEFSEGAQNDQIRKEVAEMGEGLKSTHFVENPVGWFQRYTGLGENTGGKIAEMDRQAIVTKMRTALRQKFKGMRNEAALERDLEGFAPREGEYRSESLRRMKQFDEFMRGQNAQPFRENYGLHRREERIPEAK